MRLGWVSLIVGILLFVAGKSLWITVTGGFIIGAATAFFGNINMANLAGNDAKIFRNLLLATGVGSTSGAFAGSYAGEVVHYGFSWRLWIFIPIVIISILVLIFMKSESELLPVPAVRTKVHISREMIFMVALAVGCIFVEVAMGSWSIDLLTSRGMKLGIAVVLSSIFGYLIGVSRIFYCQFKDLNVTKIWNYSTAMLLVGLIIIIFSHASFFTVMGFMIAGYGLGPLGSMGYAISMKSTHGVHIGITSFSIGSSISLIISALFMGFMSEHFGFKFAYSTVVVGVVFTYYAFIVLTKMLSEAKN
jgi:hypothetical protein